MKTILEIVKEFLNSSILPYLEDEKNLNTIRELLDRFYIFLNSLNITRHVIYNLLDKYYHVLNLLKKTSKNLPEIIICLAVTNDKLRNRTFVVEYYKDEQHLTTLSDIAISDNYEIFERDNLSLPFIYPKKCDRVNELYELAGLLNFFTVLPVIVEGFYKCSKTNILNILPLVELLTFFKTVYRPSRNRISAVVKE